MFLAFSLVQIPVGVAVGVAGAIAYLAMSPEATPDRLQKLIVMPAAILGAVVGGLIAFALARWTLPGPISSGSLILIGWRKSCRLHLLLAAVAGLALSVLYLYGLARVFSPGLHRPTGPLAAAATAGGLPRHLWALLVLLVVPPIEEFVFRGVMFAGFRRSWSAPSAATVTVLLFVASHLTEAHGAALISIALLGYATVIARIAADSLLAPIVLHVAYNLGIAVAVYGGAA